MEPKAELDPDFSIEGATATSWQEARALLADAGTYWLTTVRPDGRPHVTPLIAVLLDDVPHFCTGPDERKARNLRANRHVALTTGRNSLDEGLDVVIEGTARQVTDQTTLKRVAELYEVKYGAEWRFDVGENGFEHSGGTALVFAVAPAKGFGFRKGDYSQTRWLFP